MPKLLSISNTKLDHLDDCKCSPKASSRQLDFKVDESLSIVMQIDCLPCFNCDKPVPIKQKSDYESFLVKYLKMFVNGVEPKIVVKKGCLFDGIAGVVPCIGCRSAIEKFYKKLVDEQPNELPLDPFDIDSDGNLTLKKGFITGKSLFTLLYGSNLESIIGETCKCKQNGRCLLHSIDKKKADLNKKVNWAEFWDSISDDCRKSLIVINANELLETIDTYLKKYRFCCDCKFEVIKAFKILTGELDPSNESHFQSHLYEGLVCCAKHIHLKYDNDFVISLIQRAEDDLENTTGERHAKTLNLAQDEVLKCIGHYLYEKIKRITNAMDYEEHSWKLFFHICTYKVKSTFETQFERTLGKALDLSAILSEFDAMDLKKEKKKESKTLKKKRKSDQLKSLKDTKFDEITPEKTIDEKHTSTNEGTIPGSSSLKEDSECICLNENVVNAEMVAKPTSCSSITNCYEPKTYWIEENIVKVDPIVQIDEQNEHKCKDNPTTSLDLLSYWKKILQEEESSSESDYYSEDGGITVEEKREYYKNKHYYRRKIVEHRYKLREKLKRIKLLELNIRKKEMKNH